MGPIRYSSADENHPTRPYQGEAEREAEELSRRNSWPKGHQRTTGFEVRSILWQWYGSNCEASLCNLIDQPEQIRNPSERYVNFTYRERAELFEPRLTLSLQLCL